MRVQNASSLKFFSHCEHVMHSKLNFRELRSIVWIRNFTLMLLAWLSISSSSILVVGSGESPLVCAFWRLSLSLPLIFPLMLLKEGNQIKELKLKPFLVSVAAGAFLAFHFLTWMTSLFIISIALSTTLVVIYPLISALIESIIARTSVSKIGIFGLSVSFIGVIIALGPTGFSGKSFYGSLLALIGAFFESGYFVLGRILRQNMGIFTYASIAYSSASFFLFIFSILTGSLILPLKLNSWIYLLGLAIIPMIGGHTVMNYLLEYMPAHIVTSVALGEPAGASLMASFIFLQIPKPAVVLGMFFTIAGEYLLLRDYTRRFR